MNHEFSKRQISVLEPLSRYLLGSEEEWRFDLSLLDVVHFSGHACPSIIGAFLMAERVVAEFYPATKVCVRGEIEVEFSAGVRDGATGPIANVFSYVFGAWGESGFGGLRGEFARRDLLRFSSDEAPIGAVRFRHRPSGQIIDVSYDSGRVAVESIAGEPFQRHWRRKIMAILEHSELVIAVKK